MVHCINPLYYMNGHFWFLPVWICEYGPLKSISISFLHLLFILLSLHYLFFYFFYFYKLHLISGDGLTKVFRWLGACIKLSRKKNLELYQMVIWWRGLVAVVLLEISWTQVGFHILHHALFAILFMLHNV